MEVNQSRVTVLVGEFGSGKTELAVNMAIQSAQSGVATAVVDMDLVKPYFRTREHRQRLEEKGVTVVAPAPNLSHADLPIMPSDLSRVLFAQNLRVIMDVGGAKAAVVLGQLRHRLAENNCEVAMVVNTRRPFTRDAEGTIATMRGIEHVSGLQVNCLISNTNLGAETTREHVLEGLAVVREVSAQTGLPLKFAVLPEWIEPPIAEGVATFILQPVTHYPWM